MGPNLSDMLQIHLDFDEKKSKLIGSGSCFPQICPRTRPANN